MLPYVCFANAVVSQCFVLFICCLMFFYNSVVFVESVLALILLISRTLVIHIWNKVTREQQHNKQHKEI